jgi:hypothetical protein
MKSNRIARGLAFIILAIIIGLSTSTLFAVAASGDSPANVLTVTCQVESMMAGGTVWYKIPYRKGMELAIDLTAIDGVYFEVFAPDQVKYFPSIGKPLGQSAPNPSDPVYLKSWRGQMMQADFLLDYYYVRITNTIGIEAKYKLCANEIATLAVEPTGDSPQNGLTSAPCTLQFMNANSQIWHKVSYSSGKEFELYLKTSFANIDFDVYTPEQSRSFPNLGQPIGRGTVNPNEWIYAKSWQGHLMQDDFYYVRITNANSVQVHYQLCLNQWNLPNPYESPTPISPTRTPRVRVF